MFPKDPEGLLANEGMDRPATQSPGQGLSEAEESSQHATRHCAGRGEEEGKSASILSLSRQNGDFSFLPSLEQNHDSASAFLKAISLVFNQQ